MIKLTFDDKGLDYQIDGNGTQLLTELGTVVMAIMDDLSDKYDGTSSELMQTFCDGMIDVYNSVNDKQGD